MKNTVYTPFTRKSIPISPGISNDIVGYRPKYNITNEEDKGEASEESIVEESVAVTSPIREIVEERNDKKRYSTTNNRFSTFSDAYNRSGVNKNRFDFFAKLAEKESGFNHSIQNGFGAPAYGYFQFMQGSANGRSWDNISRFAGVDINTFRNSPEIQIKAADKLADSFLKSFSKADIEKARQLGYSDSALVAGAWLGGVGGVRKLLHNNVSVNDHSWSKDKKSGADMRSRMAEFNNFFKLGGIIKAQDGEILKGKNWLKNWLYQRRDILKDNIQLNMPIPVPFSSKLGYNIAALNINLSTARVNKDKLVAPDIAGQYNPITGRIYLDKDDAGVAIHEYTHASGPDGQISTINKIKGILGDNIYDNNTTIPDEYWDDSREIYSRLMELRYALNIDPAHKFTTDEVQKLKDNLLKRVVITNKLDGSDRRFNTEVLDSNFNIIKHDDLREGEKYVPEESNVRKIYDDKDSFEILNRYSTDFITRLLNNVAFNNTEYNKTEKYG